MLSRNITSDDIGYAQANWEVSGKFQKEYLYCTSVYQASPFPYKWDFATRSSIIPSDESMAVRGRCIDWTIPLSSSFKSRFHKARVRYTMSQRLVFVEEHIGSDFSGIYREWFDKISNRDERWSFLEFLEGLEMNDFWLGFIPWANRRPTSQLASTDETASDTTFNEGDSSEWSDWYELLGMMSVYERAGIIEYPDLADRALEPPDSFKRLISSESLPKDLEIALMQAWPSFRRNWPQTARSRVFSLYNSREALAKIQEWMEADSGTERVPLEDSGRSSLQEWLVGFVDL